MKKENLLMAFSDIGVVSSIWKAIPELAQDFNLKIYAKDTLAYKKLSECFSPEELKKYNIIPYKQMPIIDAYKIVRNENPAAVITGLSNAHKKTKSGSGMQQQEYKADFAFADAASRLKKINIGISEAAYLSPYLIRYRLNSSRRGPETMIVASHQMKKFLKDTGLIAMNKIHVLPMPRYEEASDIKNSPRLEEVRNRLYTLNNVQSGDFCIVYSSSCSPKTDLEAAKLLNNSIKDMPQVKVLFAFHPKDSAETRQALLAAVSGSREFDKGGENPLLAYTAMGKGTRRLIAGVRTSVLFDAVLTGSNVISLNPRHEKSMRSPTAELGLAPEISDIGNLKKTITDISSGIFPQNSLSIPQTYKGENAARKFARGLAKIIEEESSPARHIVNINAVGRE